MNLASALDDCLKRLAAGESTADVLSRYPEHAAVLAPMLAAAARCTVLPAARLTEPQRLRGKVALRAAMAARQARPARFAWSRAARLPLALSLALVLVMAISAAAVASSRPGDMLYSLRVAAERAPALIMINPASRAGTELDIADRRLKDLGDRLASAGEANTVALDALLLGDETAAERALGLAAGERARLAARVAGHAEELRALAAVAVDPEADEMLRTAADRAQDIVKALRDPESGATQEGGRGSVPSPQASPAAADFTPSATLAPVLQSQSTSTPTALPATRQPPNVRPPGSETPGSPPPSQEPAQTRTPRPTPTPWPTRTRPANWTPPPTRTPRPTLTPWPTRTRPANWTPPPTRTPWPTVTPWPTRTRPADWTPPSTRTPRPTVTPWPTRTRPANWTPPPTRTPRPALTPWPTRTRRPDGTPVPARTRSPDWTPQPTRPRPPGWTPRAPTAVPTVGGVMPTAEPTVVILPGETSTPADMSTPAPAATETGGSGGQQGGTPDHDPASTPHPRSTGGGPG